MMPARAAIAALYRVGARASVAMTEGMRVMVEKIFRGARKMPYAFF